MTYMQPSPQFPAVSGSLTFSQFLQSVFAGISGIAPQYCRPKWQPNPPKQPDLDIDWMALAVVSNRADANAYVELTNMQRHEDLEIQCSFYGPESQEFMQLTRDGFQIDANRAALMSAKMGFVGTNEGKRVPELVNERWIDRWEMSFFLRREILRAYPVLSFTSVSGSLMTIMSGNLKTIAWNTKL